VLPRLPFARRKRIIFNTILGFHVLKGTDYEQKDSTSPQVIEHAFSSCLGDVTASHGVDVDRERAKRNK